MYEKQADRTSSAQWSKKTLITVHVYKLAQNVRRPTQRRSVRTPAARGRAHQPPPTNQHRAPTTEAPGQARKRTRKHATHLQGKQSDDIDTMTLCHDIVRFKPRPATPPETFIEFTHTQEPRRRHHSRPPPEVMLIFGIISLIEFFGLILEFSKINQLLLP